MKQLNSAAHDVLAHYETTLDAWINDVQQKLELTEHEWVYFRREQRRLRREMRELLMAAVEDARQEGGSEDRSNDVRDIIERAIEDLSNVLVEI